ncbi:uncharacterized protein BDV14DRAFT_165679 [Aspergillus stella-maris]|uniref:uncharacterized protein n=1 Tax=Aspergillus stella-maris TaxID=1810926 RepID=UPI003CCD9DA5
MPAVRVEIEQRLLPALDHNQKGRTYDRYNEKNVKQIEFRPYAKPPPHTTGPLAANREPYGVELRTAYSV